MFGRYANEVSQHQAQGETKEKAVLLVDTRAPELFCFFHRFPFVNTIELVECIRAINLPAIWQGPSLNAQYCKFSLMMRWPSLLEH